MSDSGTSYYGDFFNHFAAKAGNDPIILQEDLPQIWQNADWLKVMTTFGLEPEKHMKSEVWIKSPFTGEENASLHVHLDQNVYKDFSSGKGGGILNFCQDLLDQQGQVMNCYQVTAWVLEKGISVLNKATSIDRKPFQKQTSPKENQAIQVDLRPFLKSGYTEFEKRGISRKACHYNRHSNVQTCPGQHIHQGVNGEFINLPRLTSLIRGRDTPISFAAWFWVMPFSLMNAST